MSAKTRKKIEQIQAKEKKKIEKEQQRLEAISKKRADKERKELERKMKKRRKTKKEISSDNIESNIEVEPRKVKFTRKKFRRFVVYGGWILFVGGFAFAVYKNFTAINTHTVYQKEVVKTEIEDVTGVEMFVKNFAKDYHTLINTSDYKNARVEQLSKYMSDDLVAINSDMSKEVIEDVVVDDVQIWNIAIDKENVNRFKVFYSVKQAIGNKTLNSSFKVFVYRKGNSFSIISSPQIASMPVKSDYVDEYLKSTDSLESSESGEIQEFLNTFFNVYPKAESKELSYYVKDVTVLPVLRDMNFISVDNLVVEKTDKGEYNVECYVKYTDVETSIIYTNQYKMKLVKQDTGELVISEME
jgi:hypothetical protein